MGVLILEWCIKNSRTIIFFPKLFHESCLNLKCSNLINNKSSVSFIRCTKFKVPRCADVGAKWLAVAKMY